MFDSKAVEMVKLALVRAEKPVGWRAVAAPLALAVSLHHLPLFEVNHDIFISSNRQTPKKSKTSDSLPALQIETLFHVSQRKKIGIELFEKHPSRVLPHTNLFVVKVGVVRDGEIVVGKAIDEVIHHGILRLHVFVICPLAKVQLGFGKDAQAQIHFQTSHDVIDFGVRRGRKNGKYEWDQHPPCHRYFGVLFQFHSHLNQIMSILSDFPPTNRSRFHVPPLSEPGLSDSDERKILSRN